MVNVQSVKPRIGGIGKGSVAFASKRYDALGKTPHINVIDGRKGNRQQQRTLASRRSAGLRIIQGPRAQSSRRSYFHQSGCSEPGPTIPPAGGGGVSISARCANDLAPGIFEFHRKAPDIPDCLSPRLGREQSFVTPVINRIVR